MLAASASWKLAEQPFLAGCRMLDDHQERQDREMELRRLAATTLGRQSLSELYLRIQPTADRSHVAPRPLPSEMIAAILRAEFPDGK